MAKRGRIKELEQLYPDLVERIVHTVNQYGEDGQKVAAETFGLSQATISRTLSARGYKRTVQYVKVQQERAS